METGNRVQIGVRGQIFFAGEGTTAMALDSTRPPERFCLPVVRAWPVDMGSNLTPTSAHSACAHQHGAGAPEHAPTPRARRARRSRVLRAPSHGPLVQFNLLSDEASSSSAPSERQMLHASPACAPTLAVFLFVADFSLTLPCFLGVCCRWLFFLVVSGSY